MVKIVLVVTLLPILFLVVLTAATIVSCARGTGAVWAQVTMYLPFFVSVLDAVVAGVLMRRAETTRRAWVMSLCAATLLVVAAFPPVYSFSKAMAEELCENAPGGRGYYGAPHEAPGR